MNRELLYELVGYAGSALVLISIFQRSVFKLRVYGAIGAALFTLYGLFIDSYPVLILNFIALGIQLYHMRELLRSPEESFRMLRMARDSEYVTAFLDFHAADIDRFFPGLPAGDDLVVVLVLRDMAPAGLFIGQRDQDRIHTVIDYAPPQFRDLKVGTYLYANTREAFGPEPVRVITARTTSGAHAAYLMKMGFVREGDEFSLQLG